MKAKLLLFSMCISYTFCCFSQKMYLRQIGSPYNEYNYTYTLQDKIESSHWIGEYKLKEKYFYNDLNQCIRIDSYQYMDDNDEWLHVSYLLYTYDDKGNLLTRINYNYDDSSGELIQNGLITYTYNDKNQLLIELTELVLPTENIPFTKRTFSYAENSKLKQILMERNINFFGGDVEWQNDHLQEFLYDKVGNILVDSTRYYDTENDELTNLNKNEYFYDKNNNLIRHNYSTWGSEWTIQKYEEYEYDQTKSAKEYVFPFNPELVDWPMLTGMNNKRTKEIQYIRDNNTYELQLFDTYEYVYDADGRPSSIKEIKSSDDVFIFPNPVNETFMLNIPDKNKPVYIYDMEGKLVISFSQARGTLNIADLLPGTYLVKCGTYTGKLLKN